MEEGGQTNLSQVRIRLRRLSRIRGVDVVPRRFPLISRQHGMSSNVACARSRGRTSEAMSKHVSRAIHSPVLQSSTLSCPFSRKRRLSGYPSWNDQGRHGVEPRCVLIYALRFPSDSILALLICLLFHFHPIHLFRLFFSFFTSFGLKCTLTFPALRVILIVGQHDTALDALYISPHSFKIWIWIFVKPPICNSHLSPCLL